MKDTEKPSAGTIARTIALVFALINQALSLTGHDIIPIDAGDLEQWNNFLLTAAASIAAWWKNNSFSREAIVSDDNMHVMKKNRRT